MKLIYTDTVDFGLERGGNFLEASLIRPQENQAQYKQSHNQHYDEEEIIDFHVFGNTLKAQTAAFFPVDGV